MKQFYQLPRPLRIVIPATFVALCIAINAIAFNELVQTFQLQPVAIISSLFRPASPIAEPAADSTAESPPTEASAALEPSSVVAPAIPAATPPAREPKYGHIAYPVADPAEMVLIASYAEGEHQRYEILHPDAAAALMQMVAAARVDGIWLVPASGFRTIAQQRTLFNEQMAVRGTPEAAAQVSAPPGYSEHHTGYALDITDGALPPDEDISLTFADTPAFEWLVAYAGTYGFELSFSEDNPNGIAYEPWHWRYVGSAEAKAVFELSDDSEAVRQ
jgi:zinc D-Ala-D-Ala carboxypeptidase